MKIGVIDNGGQWTHREWRVIRSLEVESEIYPNTVENEKLDNLDGLVLSGGPASIESEIGKLGHIKQYIEMEIIPNKYYLAQKGISRELIDNLDDNNMWL